MKEIKFRAWPTKTEDFLYSEAIGMIGFWEQVEAWDWPVTQYTGLKDKNGKEIYEGDICHYYDSEPDDKDAFENARFPDMEYDGGWHDVELTGVVEWQDETAGFTVGGTKWFDAKLEVIGNIYENPELLEPPSNEGNKE